MTSKTCCKTGSMRFDAAVNESYGFVLTYADPQISEHAYDVYESFFEGQIDQESLLPELNTRFHLP